MTASSYPSAQGENRPAVAKTIFTKENYFIAACLLAIALYDIGTAWFWKRTLPPVWLEIVLLAGGALIALIPFFIGIIACVKFYQWYGFWVLVLILVAAGPFVWGFFLPFMHWKRYGLKKSLWCLIPIVAWLVSLPLLIASPWPGFLGALLPQLPFRNLKISW